MCALLLFSVIDLSGNGFVRAEDSAYEEAASTSEDNTETPVDETPETENEISDEAPESENEISDETLGTENGMDEISENENVSETEQGEDTDILSAFITEDGFDMDAFSDFLDSLSDEEYVSFMEKYGDVLSYILDNYYEEVDTPTIYSNSGETVTAHHSTLLNFNGLQNIQVSWFNMSDGRAALCATHSLARPADGQQVADDESEDDPSVWKRTMSDELYRCFYFGWLKDKGSEIFTDSTLDDTSHSVEMGYLAVCLIATEEMYGPSYSLNTGASNLQGRMIAYANAHADEIPNAESIRFSKSNLSSSVVNNRFETEYVTFGNNDGTTQKVAITLPANITAVVKRTNGAEVTCNPNTNIEVEEGEQIKFQAPISAVGDYAITATSTEEILSKDAWCYYFGDAYQRLLAKSVFSPSTNLSFTFENPKGCFELNKVANNWEAIKNNSSYSLQGAVYGVYGSKVNANSDTNRLHTLTTNASGIATLDNIDIGTYWVREITAPTGFKLNTTPYSVTVSASNTPSNRAKVTVYEDAYYGCLELYKYTTNPDAIINCDAYSLGGAEYGIYRYGSEAATDTNRLYTLTTVEKSDNGLYGYAKLDDVLPLGTYYVKETKASRGHSLDSKTYTVKITKDNTTANRVKITSYEKVTLDPVRIIVKKTDRLDVPVVGATYKITYYKTPESYYTGADKNVDPATMGYTADRTYYFKTDSYGRINFATATPEAGSDVFYYLSDGVTRGLPNGTVTVQETEAPDGYFLDTNVYVYTVGLDPANTPYYNDSMAPTSVEYNKRGDFKFHKVDEDGNSLANVKFELTNIRTNESVIIWTDEDGYYSSESNFVLHSKNTNSGDAGDGIWFGNINDLDDNLGALTADTYRLQELLCDANKNTYKYDKIDFTFDVDTHGQVVDLGDIVNEYNVIITTSAKDSVTNAQIVALGDTLDIIDTVHLQKLEVGHTYHLKFKIWSKRDNNFLKDDAGVDIEETYTFVATDTTMDVDMTTSIIVDESFLGQDIVCFEYCTDDNYPGEEFNHADEDFASQTLYFAKIGTQAKDDVTMEHIGCVSTDATIIDTIKYENLVPNLRYDIVAKLVYLESGEPVIQDGKEYEVKDSFVPTTESGTYDVKLEHINAEALQGKTVTVLEYIYYNDKLVAKHDDLVETQSIHYPDMQTTAEDKATGTHEALAGPVTIVDTIDYQNLIAGEHLVKGYLVYTDNGEPVLIDGKKVEAEKRFTPGTPDGSVTLEYTFDASILAGRDVTVFEDLYYNERKICTHADVSSKEQTINFPAISTIALDSVSLSHDGKRSHYSVIEDEISYSNVTVGEKYQIKGYLVDKDTKELFLDENGTPVTYTGDVFIPEQASGTIKATFNVDSIDLLGKSLVVYEELFHVYDNGEIVLIAEHKDAADKNQTVTYDSKVGTLTITIDDLPAHGGMPKTSDSTNLFLLFFLMATSGIGLLVAALYLRKNNKMKR